MKPILIPHLTLALLAAIAPAHAADEHKGHSHGKTAAAHADDTQPLKGGVVTVVKDVAYELVASPDGLALYVSDHGKPVDLKGASAKITLLQGSARSEAALAFAGDRLESKGSFKVGAGTKAAARITYPGGRVVAVTFTLK